MIKFIKRLYKRFTKVSMGVLSLAVMLGFMSMGAPAFANVNITTDAATAISSTSATVNGTNGPVNATDTSFWLGTTTAGPFTSSASPVPPAGWAGVDSLVQLANAPFSHAYTGLLPSTTYYFAAWSNVGGIWYPGNVLSFTTEPTILPGTLLAENFGVDSNTGLGTVNGYATGFGLTNADFTNAQSMVVQLFAGSTLLQTNTLTGAVTGIQISSPFDIMGTYFTNGTDGYWTNVREAEYGQTLAPTKVVATVILANGKTVTAENITPPTGDYATINQNSGTLLAENFGVDSNTGLGTVNGYATGFGLTDATLANTTSVVVQLFAAGDVLLQTNTAIMPAFSNLPGTQFSSPFDVSGSFNYATDGYWTNLRATQYGQSVPAIKVVATVTLANGKVVMDENTNMIGDATTIYPVNVFTLTYTAGANGTITGISPQSVNLGLNGTAVTAVANSGYHFVNWSDNSSTVATRTDTSVTGNITTTAIFAANGNGGGSSSGSRPAVPAKVATPNGCEAGNKFSTTTGRNCNAATPATHGQVLGAEKFNFTKFMKNGSKGNEIIELQNFLTTFGYTLTADGNFGVKTKGAVIKFQIANSLKGDGVVGALTRAILNK